MQVSETSSTRPTDVSAQTGNWVLFATILASSMAFIDGSALNVALPTLQADLQAGGAELLWIVNAYAVLLAIAVFGAIALFTFGSALAARTSGLDLPTQARVALQAQAAN